MNLAPELPSSVQRSLAVLRGGGLVAFPAETVYGLGADARNPEAVARIFAAKGWPLDHPLRRVAGSGDGDVRPDTTREGKE